MYRHKRHTQDFRQSGVTLVELMVAMVISLLLLAGTIELFSGTKQTYRTVDAVSRLQENGRFAISFIAPEIRMAGFMGCGNNTKGMSIANNLDTAAYTASVGTQAAAIVAAAAGTFDGTNNFVAYSHSSGNSLDADLTALGLGIGTSAGDVRDTDQVILLMKRGGRCQGGGFTNQNNGGANFTVEDVTACGINQDDVVIVSDCQNADIVGVTNTTSAANTVTHGNNYHINSPPVLSTTYDDDAAVFKVVTTVFYIGTGASGEPALYRLLVNGRDVTTEELIDGVESMTAVFGVDINNDDNADIYVDSANIEGSGTYGWDDVVAVRLSVTTRSFDNVSLQGADRRLRQTFTTTIAIRNRVLGS